MFLRLYFLAFSLAAVQAIGPQWMDKSLSSEKRALLLLVQMTMDEKISMLHGTSGSGYVGYVAENTRLGIPALKINDGPQGFRDDSHPGSTTCWPSALTMGATWDRKLCFQWGEAIAQEFYGKGSNVMLGPGLNLARVPLNGRNFEYLSGGDPYLGYTLVQPVVRGIQSTGVIANAKHWVENNQETDRDTVSAHVDERTRHELYYQPFYGAVESGVGSFMCSYNKINDIWSCENPETLTTDLKGHLGFRGWVMSDWGAVHSLSIEAGLDQEMPGDEFFGSKLLSAVDFGTVAESTVNAAVLRILQPMFAMGLFDNPNMNTLENVVTSTEHFQLARIFSAQSHVLLKNSGALPLDGLLGGIQDRAVKIAIFGMSALEPVLGGGGSGAVFPSEVISPYRGILEAVGIEPEPIHYDCKSELYESVQFNQWGCQSSSATSVEDCGEQCGRYSNCHYFTYNGGHCGFYPTAAGKRPTTAGTISGKCEKSQPSSQWRCNERNTACVAFMDGTDLNAASLLAEGADVAIVAISQFSREGSDRESLSFDETNGQQCQVVPLHQDVLVDAIAAANANTIVAATAPGAVLMPWKDSVNAILLGFMPGQEYGHGLADVLFGSVNPTARLPMTIPNVENEVGFSRSQYPGVNKVATYSEQLLIDYRWYVAHNVTPAFAFGHGLSYTAFSYSNLTISDSTSASLSNIEISVTVENVGKRAGAEIVQLYVVFPLVAHAAPLQLRGFVKTEVIQPGESVSVEFVLDRRRDLVVWDDKKAHDWMTVPGVYEIRVGASSQDIRLSGQISIDY